MTSISSCSRRSCQVRCPSDAVHEWWWSDYSGQGGTGQLGLGNEDDFALPQLWDNAQVSLTVRWSSFLRKHVRDIDVVCAANCQYSSYWSWHLSRPVAAIVQVGDKVAEAALIVQVPLQLLGALRVASIACGWKHSLLATVDGEVFSWGSGRHGQLGLGDGILKTESPVCIEALNGAAITNVFCGWEHSVFRSSSGEVFTCGNNRHGQLGVQNSMSAAADTPRERRKQVIALPVRVADPHNKCLALRTAQIGCGWHYVLCLTEGGNLVTWGKGSHGQLGLGELENAYEPQIVGFTYPVQQIACGSEHSMVVTSTGDLYTCGWGEHGNLGTPLLFSHCLFVS
ncbi:unnamed protein product [Phytophthora fragariaefolia]|uniref:Unnamed protein product n=1 Tax=Phytophthora fragariaefolia TaxID=1490495 RepID=A0A9W6XLC1_9STRA|nr:unnamed protein product [Phytophthora fragariaefolia]